VVENSVKAVEN